jgi:hypothetical protein
MDKKELKAVLSNFDFRAGSQLKYYIIKSVFPDASFNTILSIGNFNERTFPSIKKEVDSKELPPLTLAADATTTTSPADGELQSKFDKLEEELKAARETILHLKNEMEEKDFLYSKSKSSYMEENVRLRKDVEYLQCELKKKQLVEPLQVRVTHSNGSKVKMRTPEPSFEELEDIWIENERHGE